MRLRMTHIGCTLALVAGAAAFTGCESENRMAEATARGAANVRFNAETGAMYRLYTYYPDSGVYHSVFQDRYWFQDDQGDWQEVAVLPSSMELGNRDRIVELSTSRPYVEHEMVAAQYPSITELEVLAGVTPSWSSDFNGAQMANASSDSSDAAIPASTAVAGVSGEH